LPEHYLRDTTEPGVDEEDQASMSERRIRTSTLNLRLDNEVFHAAERAANDGRRSVTSFVERLLADYLHTNGYLRRPGDEGLRPEELTSENDG
jgi:predicted HicB family RNase H-like nuclease